ncbi:MAG: glycoside hydrolase family 127 protein, partial [Lachnospiraceae bacterium]|nr:glycoside hydrolase family 127 protein [Lachnospiraceae bacterium]
PTGQIQNTRELKQEEFGTYIRVPVAEGISRTELVLDMPVTLVRANPMIEETTGQLAVTKGPLVYCLENIEENRYSLNQIWLEPDREFTEGFVEIGGVRIPTLETTGIRKTDRGHKRSEKNEAGAAASDNQTNNTLSEEAPDYLAQPLYEVFDPGELETQDVLLRFIPYFAWDNRGPGEMRVWIQGRV